MSYLVTEYYNGLHVDPMRLFDNECDAWAYWDTLHEREWCKRIYKVSSDQSPILLKSKNRPS